MKLILVLILLTFCLTFKHRSKQCPCDTQGCPSCMLMNTLIQNHIQAAEINLQDSELLQKQSQSADLQQKLFEEAEKAAKECNELEEQAKEAAGKLQELASKAQSARNRYMKIQNQAKDVAIQTLKTVQVHTPPFNNLHVVPVGIKTKQIIQNTPEYQITITGDIIGKDSGSGPF